MGVIFNLICVGYITCLSGDFFFFFFFSSPAHDFKFMFAIVLDISVITVFLVLYVYVMLTIFIISSSRVTFLFCNGRSRHSQQMSHFIFFTYFFFLSSFLTCTPSFHIFSLSFHSSFILMTVFLSFIILWLWRDAGSFSFCVTGCLSVSLSSPAGLFCIVGTLSTSFYHPHHQPLHPHPHHILRAVVCF